MTIDEIIGFLTMNQVLADRPLSERNAAMVQCAESALEYWSQLPEYAQWRVDFWRQIKLERIEKESYQFEIETDQTYRWNIDTDPEGLIFTDISGQYAARKNHITVQLWSEFWFFGPSLPIPDLFTRKMLIAKIRNAFIQAGSPASYRHFPIIDYDALALPPKQWIEGDQEASSFVTLLPFGIETGQSNWRDGLAYRHFISFENMLTLPPDHFPVLTPEINAELSALFLLRPKQNEDKSRPVSSPASYRDQHYTEKVYPPSEFNLEERMAESKRLYMDNGGHTHYIYLDGDGDRYFGKPSDEAKWREELLAQYADRIGKEDHGPTLTYIVKNMLFHGVENVESKLIEAAKTASPAAKQAIAQALKEACNSNFNLFET